MRNATCVGIQTTKVPTRASDLALYFLFCALTQLIINYNAHGNVNTPLHQQRGSSSFQP